MAGRIQKWDENTLSHLSTLNRAIWVNWKRQKTTDDQTVAPVIMADPSSSGHPFTQHFFKIKLNSQPTSESEFVSLQS